MLKLTSNIIQSWLEEDIKIPKNKVCQLISYKIVQNVHALEFVYYDKLIDIQDVYPTTVEMENKLPVPNIRNIWLNYEHAKSIVFNLSEILLEYINMSIDEYDLPEEFCIYLGNSKFKLGSSIYYDFKVGRYKQTNYLNLLPFIDINTCDDTFLKTHINNMNDKIDRGFGRVEILDLSDEQQINTYLNNVGLYSEPCFWKYQNEIIPSCIVLKLNEIIKSNQDLYIFLKYELKMWSKDNYYTSSIIDKFNSLYVHQDKDIYNHIQQFMFSGYSNGKIDKNRKLVFRIKPSLDEAYRLRFNLFMKPTLKILRSMI